MDHHPVSDTIKPDQTLSPMPESLGDGAGASIAPEDRDRLMAACVKALNLVYFVLIFATVPLSAYRHLWLRYSDIGWVFVVGPLIYLPVALGWFPRRYEHRIVIAAALWLLAAVSINGVNEWYSQPGLYVLLPPTLAIYIAFGVRALLAYSALIIGVISAFTLTHGYPVIDVVIAMLLWVAVGTAGCLMVGFLTDSWLKRTQSLEATAAQLAERESETRTMNESMSRMFAVIAHELRTPASSIAMLSSKPDRADLNLEEIHAVADHLLHVIDDLRMAVTPDTHMAIELKPVSLGDLKSGLEQQLQPIATARGTVLTMIVTDSDLRVVTDPYRVRTVVSNLTRNALLHSQGSRVMVVMGVTKDDAGALHLRIAVEDDGVGVAPEDRAIIFELFARGSTASGGTGVGLYLASQWAASLGGALSLAERSELGGARFDVSIPVESAGVIRDVSAQEDASKRARDWLRGKSVLVVEDDALLRRMTSELLGQQLSMTVSAVADAVEATQMLEEYAYDLILTDYFMPKMNGAELARLLRQAGCDLPIIAVTAATIGDERLELLEAGVDHVLPKPLTDEKMLAAVADVISGTAS